MSGCCIVAVCGRTWRNIMRAMKSAPSHRLQPRFRRLSALVAVAGVAIAGSAATGSHTVTSGETLSDQRSPPATGSAWLP